MLVKRVPAMAMVMGVKVVMRNIVWMMISKHGDRVVEDISTLKGVVVTSDVRAAAPSQNHKGRKQL